MHSLHANPATPPLDRGVGERYKLQEIRLMMQEDKELKNLSTEREAELIAELKEYWAVQKQGARASNRAAALDYQGTIKHIHQEVSIQYFLNFPSHCCFVAWQPHWARRMLRAETMLLG